MGNHESLLEFLDWYKSQERLFYTSHFLDKDIAASAWYAGIKLIEQQQKEKDTIRKHPFPKFYCPECGKKCWHAWIYPILVGLLCACTIIITSILAISI